MRSFSTLVFHGSGDSQVVSWVPSYSYEGWIRSLIGWIHRSMNLLMTPMPFTSSSFLQSSSLSRRAFTCFISSSEGVELQDFFTTDWRPIYAGKEGSGLAM